MNLLKRAEMQHIDVIIQWHKYDWIGHTLRNDESSVARQAMQWNPLDGIGRKKGRPCEIWRRTVERECKNLKKPGLIWNKCPSQDFFGELALLMPSVPVGKLRRRRCYAAQSYVTEIFGNKSFLYLNRYAVPVYTGCNCGSSNVRCSVFDWHNKSTVTSLHPNVIKKHNMTET